MATSDRVRISVLGAHIDAIDWPQAINILLRWSEVRESRYVCICNVHSVVTATQDAEFMDIVNAADLATPDGAPIAWMVGRLGPMYQERINGPDLMWRYLAQMEHREQSVFFFGSTDSTLGRLRCAIGLAYPGVRIAGMYAPPFREVSDAEDEAAVRMINSSGAGAVFVGLGCPKQERWMASHRGRVSAVMIGVGAAFDYHAGELMRAPAWMQRCGLEWLHRLLSEPGRLWRRYLVTNSIFLYRVMRQLLNKLCTRKRTTPTIGS